jgi:CspA family cold shock protein
MPERFTGTVAKWLNHKGIGFITPENAEEGKESDILVHFKQIKQESEDGFVSLEAGAQVEFELEEDPKDSSKKVAVNVTGVDGADCAPKKKGSGKGKGKKGKGKGRKGKGKGKGKKSSEEKEAEEE